MKRREEKSKEEKERYTHLNAEFQRIARRDKKAFLRDQCKATEELHKKDLVDPDNHNGMLTHLDPDILECEVKGALGSITMNKASGGDGISVELFQVLKDEAVKVLHAICQQIRKTQQWLQDWKRSAFMAMPKNA